MCVCEALNSKWRLFSARHGAVHMLRLHDQFVLADNNMRTVSPSLRGALSAPSLLPLTCVFTVLPRDVSLFYSHVGTSDEERVKDTLELTSVDLAPRTHR